MPPMHKSPLSPKREKVHFLPEAQEKVHFHQKSTPPNPDLAAGLIITDHLS